MKPCFRGSAALFAALTGLPALAQDFTTAAEVKPILQATRPQWIAIREFDGKDLIYFTNLLAWRCGVERIAWGINGGAPQTVMPMEPCHEGEAAPNALKMETVLPYAEAPLGAITSVSVAVTFDDGSVEVADYDRSAVLMP
ncbi:hypothetical protein MASR1M32_18750 [Rhodobacter sp.]